MDLKLSKRNWLVDKITTIQLCIRNGKINKSPKAVVAYKARYSRVVRSLETNSSNTHFPLTKMLMDSLVKKDVTTLSEAWPAKVMTFQWLSSQYSTWLQWHIENKCCPLLLASKLEDFANWLGQTYGILHVYICEIFTRPRPRGCSSELCMRGKSECTTMVQKI